MGRTRVPIRTLLGQTDLRARSTLTIPVLASRAVAVAVEIDASEVLTAWEIGRDLLDESGCWPVVVAAWMAGGSSWRSAFESENLFNRFPFQEHSTSEDASPDAILRRAADIDASEALDSLFAANPSILDSPNRKWKGTDEHLQWFVPSSMPVALLFLPSAEGPDALAYLHWYAAIRHDSASFVAILRRWRQQWGAELVAHYGTILQFVVERPPQDLQSAHKLAEEQVIVAPCTTGLQGVDLSSHATALLNRRTWFLHERP